MKEPNFDSEIHDKKNWQEEFAKSFEMSPKELVDFLAQLDEEGKIEEFLEEATKNDAMKAKLSYWEKWLEKDHQDLLEQVIKEKKEMYDGENSSNESLPLGLEKKFNKEDLELIFSNLAAIQLTFGCSKGCPFCGVDAVPGVKDHIPYTELANLFQKYGKEIGKTSAFLYWASEPSDYKDESAKKTYQDVHQLASEYAGYNPSITSRKTDEEWLNFIGTQKNSRVSLEFLSDKKFEELEKKAEDLGIQSTWSNKFARKHKEGIGKSFKDDKPKRKTKNPEGTGGEKGIGCVDGILLAPRGIYNVVLLDEVGSKYPQGQIVVPVENIIVDKKVNLGDKIEPHLSSSVVQELSFLGTDIDPISMGKEYKYNYFRKIGEHKLRRGFNLLKSKDLGYKVWIDRGGIVQRVEQLTNFDIENVYKRKEEKKESERYEKIVKENIDQLLNDAVTSGNVNTENISNEIKDVFLKEILAESIDIKLKRKLRFFHHNYDSKAIHSFSSSMYIKLQEKYFDITIDIEYDPEENSISVVAEDVDYIVKKEKMAEKWALDNEDRIINETLKEGKIEFFTNWTDEQKKNITDCFSKIQKADLKDLELVIAKKDKSYFSAKYEIKEGEILDLLITIDNKSEKGRIDCI